jgi:hypothetical protein
VLWAAAPPAGADHVGGRAIDGATDQRGLAGSGETGHHHGVGGKRQLHSSSVRGSTNHDVKTR